MTTDDREDPAVLRRRLRMELRLLRMDAAMTQREVAQAMDWGLSKVIRIENGDSSISRNDLIALADHLGAERRRVDELVAMARGARGASAFAYCRSLYAPGLVTYLGMETAAGHLWCYDSVTVPGLLQTEAYAVATHPADADLTSEATRHRQGLHERARPPRMVFFVDESVVRRQVGGSRTLRGQLQALVEWSARNHVTIRALPFEAGAYDGVGEPFALVQFKDPRDDDLVASRGANGDVMLRFGVDEAARYRERLVELDVRALSQADTVALIQDVERRLTGPRLATG